MTSTISEVQVEAAGRALAKFHACEGDDGFRACDPTHCTCRKIARAALIAAAQAGEENDLPEVTKDQVRAIDELVRPEFETGNWQAVEDEGPAPLGRANEVNQLRVALQRIVDEADSDDGLTAWDGGDIARAALAAAPSPPVQSGEGQGEDTLLVELREQGNYRDQPCGRLCVEAADRITALTQALAEAEKVIAPFAKLAKNFDEERAQGSTRTWDDAVWLSEDECRRARAFLGRDKGT